MKKVVRLSNPLNENVVPLEGEWCFVHDENKTFISESDAVKLKLIEISNNSTDKHCELDIVPLKIQQGSNIAYITAFVSGRKTTIGRLAVDELSDRL
ncbi:hypothetical protein [Marinicella meishanensis]|uniref:hypothetical protein n=1 Tax=Marinicella meishanensis TaxID=2873263 RepID=UPI001CBF04F4|nr:hypothetical protein [Marinicella sp. NBU2979]